MVNRVNGVKEGAKRVNRYVVRMVGVNNVSTFSALSPL